MPVEGRPVPNGRDCGDALSGDVNGPVRVPFSREPGQDQSNPKGTPSEQHRETTPAGCGSRWGTVSMPPWPLDHDGKNFDADDASLCQHGLLWRPCPRKATWGVAVMAELKRKSGSEDQDSLARVIFGLCPCHMEAWFRATRDPGSHPYYDMYSKIEIDENKFDQLGGIAKLNEDIDSEELAKIQGTDRFVIETLLQQGWK